MRVAPLSDEQAEAVAGLVPVPQPVEVEAAGTGIVFVLEKELGWVSEKLRSLLGASDEVRVRLDEKGRAVWERIDGTRTVAEIAGELEERFGDEVDPALARTWTFVQLLARRGIVEIERG